MTRFPVVTASCGSNLRSLWLTGLSAVLLISSGCVGFGPRPQTFAPMSGGGYPPVYQVPGQVSPQATPSQSNKPVGEEPTPEEVLPSDPKPSQSNKTPETSPNDSLEDAPSWNADPDPRETESWRPNNPPLPAPGEPLETELGEPSAFPGTRTRSVQVSAGATTRRPQQATRVNELWISTAQSAGGRPIEVARTGQGDAFTLVIGSLYGNEPEAIALMDQLNRMLREGSKANGTVVLMIRTPNPDGLNERIRTNDNGVELNRNFPSLNFPIATNALTGPHPSSEPETEFVVRVLNEYKPTRVIHLRSSIGNRPLILLNDRWDVSRVQQGLSRSGEVTVFRSEHKAGSLEEFLQERTTAQLATILLPPEGFPQLSANELAWLAMDSINNQQLSPAKDDSIARTTPGKPAATADDGTRGIVDMLPAPPEFARRNGPDIESSQARFEELPPPPR
ncbi:MAG: DUF2817 domain-containing protein [Planctomycetaceae bacterium]|nr:DUF2817 domain-containing protein [Planctomycetaceae bacterium]